VAISRASSPDSRTPPSLGWSCTLCTARRAIKERTPLGRVNREENEVGTGLHVRFLPNISVESIPVKPCNIQVALEKIWPPGRTRAVHSFQPLWQRISTREVLFEALGVSRRELKGTPRPR